jgi:hypothetical protein
MKRLFGDAGEKAEGDAAGSRDIGGTRTAIRDDYDLLAHIIVGAQRLTTTAMSIYRYGKELLWVVALAFLHAPAARADWLIRQSGSLSSNESPPFPRIIVVGRTAVKVTAANTQDIWDLAAKIHIRIDQAKREYWQEPLRAPWIFSNAERPSSGRSRVAGIDCTRYEDSTRREYHRGVVTGNNTQTRFCIAPQITADPSLREIYTGVLEKMFPPVASILGFVLQYTYVVERCKEGTEKTNAHNAPSCEPERRLEESISTTRIDPNYKPKTGEFEAPTGYRRVEPRGRPENP